jgi:cytochrome b
MQTTKPTIRVWDLSTRVFHWSLVALVGFSAMSGEFADDLGADFMQWHKLSGYAIVALLLFRLVWGFVGGTYARFASFARGPGAVLAYAKGLLGRESGTSHIGHNPLGGWSVLAMLASLALQVGTGLFVRDDDLDVEGPFFKLVSNATADRLMDLHEGNFALLLTLIGIHLGAIAFYRLVKGENLVHAMLTGRKDVAPEHARQAASGGHVLLGIFVLAMAAGAVWLLVNKV